MRTFLIYYMTESFWRDGSAGPKFLREHNKLPALADLSQTHTLLREVEADDLEEVWTIQQAEVWSPKGEARPLIERLGLVHTSMSVGDIAVDKTTNEVFMADRIGFTSLGVRP